MTIVYWTEIVHMALAAIKIDQNQDLVCKTFTRYIHEIWHGLLSKTTVLSPNTIFRWATIANSFHVMPNVFNRWTPITASRDIKPVETSNFFLFLLSLVHLNSWLCEALYVFTLIHSPRDHHRINFTNLSNYKFWHGLKQLGPVWFKKKKLY